jgi:ribosomal protein L37E
LLTGKEGEVMENGSLEEGNLDHYKPCPRCGYGAYNSLSGECPRCGLPGDRTEEEVRGMDIRECGLAHEVLRECMVEEGAPEEKIRRFDAWGERHHQLLKTLPLNPDFRYAGMSEALAALDKELDTGVPG